MSQGMGLNTTAQARHDKGVRGIDLAFGDWAWGELVYDKTYNSNLFVTNDCPTPQPVYAWVGSGISPYVTIAEVTMVPGRTKDFKVPITITTPPIPENIIPPPYNPADPLASEIWVDIGARPLNRLVLEHFADPMCRSDPKKYAATGHIHARDGGGDDPESDACTAIWNTGNPLPGVNLEQCTERWRELLLHFRARFAAAAIEADPAAWAWFPTAETVVTMGAEELLDAKKRAQRQLAGEAAE